MVKLRCSNCGKEVDADKCIQLNDFINENAWVYCSWRCFHQYYINIPEELIENGGSVS